MALAIVRVEIQSDLTVKMATISILMIPKSIRLISKSSIKTIDTVKRTLDLSNSMKVDQTVMTIWYKTTITKRFGAENVMIISISV
jgi:hypothetical protein